MLLWVLALALPLYGLARGHEVEHNAVGGVALLAITVLASRTPGRPAASSGLVALGLCTASALAIHLANGAIEAHFMFFVVIIVMALYEDWRPFLIAIAFVFVHHGAIGVIAPASVYNYAGNPWVLAMIHGAFVLAASIAAVVSWRLNEDVRNESWRASEHARVKDEFISVVSHELRTPLTSIRGSLGLLESGALGPLPDKGQRMVEIAVQSSDRLVRLINDVLDLERIDCGAIDLREVPCDAEQLIAAAVEIMLPLALAAEVTLTVDAAPARLEGDADRLVQTLTNLIGNAVKFSPRGGTVRITSKRAGGEVLFSVADRGRGIPADKLETIFERFAQVDSSDSRQKGGTGLGLAISREIVEHHGGRISVLSALDEGSTFTFVVPALRDSANGFAAENRRPRLAERRLPAT